jgi:hypothetical protein
MLCPTDIKTYSSAREFVQTEASLVSRARVGLMLSQIAEQYRWWCPENGEPSNFIQKIATPRDFESLFWAVISEIFDTMPEEASGDAAAVEGPDGGTRYHTFQGLPNVDVIAEAIASGRRVERGMIEALRSTAYEGAHRGDVLTLYYMGLDNSRPILRFIVASFYFVGFVVLLIPTVLTFVQLAVSLLRS